MISTNKPGYDQQLKKLNQILTELEIHKSEIINLKRRIDYLENLKQIESNKFKCIKDVIIWTDEETNKKNIFRIPKGFNINQITNMDIDNNGLILINWGNKNNEQLKISEDLYYYLKELMPDEKSSINNLRYIFDKLNYEKIITDEMQRIWDVVIKYRDLSLKTRAIYLKAKVAKQTAHNHLNLFTRLGFIRKLPGNRWQLKDIDLDNLGRS